MTPQERKQSAGGAPLGAVGAAPQDEAKRAAARAAVDEVAALGDGEVKVGLGSGSTARFFVEELATRGLRVTGVPTSESTRALAAKLGIPMLDDDGPWGEIDLCVDGADEVSTETFDLVKGGGGAHTREKIVNAAARRNVIIVDGSKLSKKLGEKWHVPVEILRFAFKETMRRLGAHGTVTLREKPTDANNLIADVDTGVIADPAALDRALHAIPGVVETGLFVGRADLVLVAEETGIRRLTRAGT